MTYSGVLLRRQKMRGWKGNVLVGRSTLPCTLSLLVLSLSAEVTRAQERDYDTRVGIEIQESIRRLDAESGEWYQQAADAEQRGDLTEARRLVSRVEERLPQSPHPKRRLCILHLAEASHALAEEYCGQALELEESAENLTAMALVLVDHSDYRRALDLSQQAVRLAPDSWWAQSVRFSAQIESGEIENAAATARVLRDLGPEHVETWLSSAMLAAAMGEWDQARDYIEQAEARGYPPALAEDWHRAIDEEEPFHAGWWAISWKVGVVWLGVMLLLLLAGVVLSALTMRAARPARGRDPTDTGAQQSGAFVRRLYAVVLWLACGFYFVSLPLIMLAVVAIAGLIIYGFLAVGRIPIKFVLIVVVVVAVTLWAILKGLLARAKDEDPGPLLDLDAHPKLKDAIHEVARKMDTRPVDRVFLTPGTDLAVFERGGIARQLRGHTERCLILGAGVLEGMDVRAFKAILAHEYGHFVNRDTAGGGFALAVRRSLLTAASAMAEGGAAAWYNPAWLFLNGFHRVFLRISQGASRLQEILADRWAALGYGASAFERGLRHVVGQSIRFNAHLTAVVQDSVERGSAVRNLYRYELPADMERRELDDEIEEALSRQTSPYDSHPAPNVRFELVRALNVVEQKHHEDRAGVWSLFEDREKIEGEMTEEARFNIMVAYGIALARGEEPAPASAAAE